MTIKNPRALALNMIGLAFCITMTISTIVYCAPNVYIKTKKDTILVIKIDKTTKTKDTLIVDKPIGYIQTKHFNMWITNITNNNQNFNLYSYKMIIAMNQ